MRKLYAASGNLKLKEFCVILWWFLTVFFHWIYKMRHSCYQEYFVIHGWFVYCVFGSEMRRLSEIRFRKASFLKMSLLTSPCLMRKRVEKFLPYLMAFRTCIPTGKPESFLYLMFFYYYYFSKKSSVVYAAWCAFVRFDQVWYKLTELLKKAFRHFLTANRKKTFRRIFSFNFGCKKKTLRDFFASRSSLKNSKYQDAGLKHKLKSARFYRDRFTVKRMLQCISK